MIGIDYFALPKRKPRLAPVVEIGTAAQKVASDARAIDRAGREAYWRMALPSIASCSAVGGTLGLVVGLVNHEATLRGVKEALSWLLLGGTVGAVVGAVGARTRWANMDRDDAVRALLGTQAADDNPALADAKRVMTEATLAGIQAAADEAAVYHAVVALGEATERAIAEKIHVNVDRVRYALARLKQSGRIKSAAEDQPPTPPPLKLLPGGKDDQGGGA